MKTLTPEEKEKRIEKLPEWARDHIKSLTRKANEAVAELKESLDGQTPSGVYYKNYLNSTKLFTERYMQTREVVVKGHGVYLIARIGLGGRGDDCLHLSWGGGRAESLCGNECAFIPTSHQQARIVAKAYMRD